MSLNGAVLSLSSATGGFVGGLLLAVGGYAAIGWSGPILGLVGAILAWNSGRASGNASRVPRVSR
jgi:predicted MFS family arabinose efflux permease